MFSILFLAIGICIGLFINGNRAKNAIPNEMHQMGSGQMMQNDMMGMNDAMGGMMAGLSGKTGDAFDKAFIDEMIMHHEGAVVMAEAALKNAKHPEIKTMANAIISAQTTEINQMKSWRSSWFNN